MLKPESKQAVSNFFAAAETEFNAFLKARSPEEYEAAAQLILDSQAKGGRLHVTGIGKCSHVSTYAASLFSSTGNPAYYLHGTEAVHGSCGQLAAGDVVIAISNSGETAELKATVLAVQNNGCKVIGVSGNPNSWLAKHTDAFLFAGVKAEGGPLNRAPATPCWRSCSPFRPSLWRSRWRRTGTPSNTSAATPAESWASCGRTKSKHSGAGPVPSGEKVRSFKC